MVVEVITLGQETTSSLEVICPEISSMAVHSLIMKSAFLISTKSSLNEIFGTRSLGDCMIFCLES